MTILSTRKTRKLVHGFTLVETMVAVTILTLAVSGPLYVASRALVAAEIASDNLTASYLAQEGIEYVRAMRDDAYLNVYNPTSGTSGSAVSSTAWSNFLTFIIPCKGAYACTLDASPGVITGVASGHSLAPCLVGSCPVLYLDAVAYNQKNSGTPTSYTRTVWTENVPGAPVDTNGNPVDVRIVSKVSWVFHGTPYSVIIADHLTPWQ